MTLARDPRIGEIDRPAAPRRPRPRRSIGRKVTASAALQAVAIRSEPVPVRLSLVMAAHNEAPVIAHAVTRLLAAPLPCPLEVIVVDDGSTDETFDILSGFSPASLRLHRHPKNLGKGAAVRMGASLATGTHLLVFDADLEYDPVDIARLVEPVIAGTAAVVYGTRMFGINTSYPSYRYALGNRITTLVANVLFDSCVTDLHTCLKLIPLDMFRSLLLREQGFGLDSEITGELLRRGVRPFEVAISYRGRSRNEGKQITWRDGVTCLKVLGQVRLRGKTTARLEAAEA